MSNTTEKVDTVMLWRKKQITPARIIIVGFALLILTGTLLLMLPISTK